MRFRMNVEEVSYFPPLGLTIFNGPVEGDMSSIGDCVCDLVVGGEKRTSVFIMGEERLNVRDPKSTSGWQEATQRGLYTLDELCLEPGSRAKEDWQLICHEAGGSVSQGHSTSG